MEKLLIGEVIYRLRKEKGITQDTLANFIGVSTAAVSKWESGISYPDITLLPVLASFFNVTIDNLLNFKIELSDEEVINIFSECDKLFNSCNLSEAMNISKNYIEKYPNSYYLKLKIGLLFTLYLCKESREEERRKMMCYAIEQFEDVSTNSSKLELVEHALFQLGALYQLIEEEDKAIAALNKIHTNHLDPNLLLSNIYIEKGDYKKARNLLQNKLYLSINDIVITCLGLINSYIKNEKDLNIIEKYYNLIINIKKEFSSVGGTGLTLSTEYLHFAITYLKFNETKKAINMLNKLLEATKIHDMNSPEKFSSIWCFNELEEKGHKLSLNLYENLFKIFEAPEFDLIREDKEFLEIVKELKGLEKQSLK